MKEQFLKIVQKAPSPHNTQPFLWKVTEQKKIELWVTSEKLLHVSDRELRDLNLSAGAAFSLAELACADLGFAISNLVLSPVTMKLMGQQKFLEFDVVPATRQEAKDLKIVESRACYRGVFEKSTGPLSFASPDVSVLTDDSKKRKIAELYDEAIAFFMSDASYAGELNQWLRLSKRHPRFYVDGLNADSLRLNPVLAFISSFIMKPAVLGFLGKLGILKSLITEKPQNLSAEGILVIKRNHAKSLFEQGREMYLTWLELERQGRMFCPITSLIDDKKFESELRALVGSSEEIIHVLRFGKKPEKEVLGLTPRISIHELSKEA